MPEMPGAEAVPGTLTDQSFETDVQSRVSESDSDTTVAAPAQSSQDTAVAASSSRAKVLSYKDCADAKRRDAAVREQIMSNISKSKEETGIVLHAAPGRKGQGCGPGGQRSRQGAAVAERQRSRQRAAVAERQRSRRESARRARPSRPFCGYRFGEGAFPPTGR